jgi:hypothetical protein
MLDDLSISITRLILCLYKQLIQLYPPAAGMKRQKRAQTSENIAQDNKPTIPYQTSYGAGATGCHVELGFYVDHGLPGASKSLLLFSGARWPY